MLYVLLFTILSFSQLVSDTVEAKGTKGISYRVLVNQDTLSFQYKINHKWSDPIVLDNGNVASPSMAISSGNYLHIVWCKKGGVYYRTTFEPITKNILKNKIILQWSPKIKISTRMPQTEPASDLFIQTYGDTIFIDWYCPGEIGNSKEKWRRTKWILEPYYEWFLPTNYNIESELKR